MGENRLSHLVRLCIEHAYVNRVGTEKVIDEFSSQKSLLQVFFLTNFYTKQRE